MQSLGPSAAHSLFCSPVEDHLSGEDWSVYTKPVETYLGEEKPFCDPLERARKLSDDSFVLPQNLLACTPAILPSYSENFFQQLDDEALRRLHLDILLNEEGFQRIKVPDSPERNRHVSMKERLVCLNEAWRQNMRPLVRAWDTFQNEHRTQKGAEPQFVHLRDMVLWACFKRILALSFSPRGINILEALHDLDVIDYVGTLFFPLKGRPPVVERAL